MCKEGHVSGITADTPVMLDDQLRTPSEGVGQLTRPVMPMNVTADGVTRLEVRGCGASGFVAGDLALGRGALDAGEHVTNVETKLCVQGQGTVVVGGLNKANPWGGAFCG